MFGTHESFLDEMVEASANNLKDCNQVVKEKRLMVPFSEPGKNPLQKRGFFKLMDKLSQGLGRFLSPNT